MKNYSAITDAYLTINGLKKYTYLDYLGVKKVAFLDKKEARRRGF